MACWLRYRESGRWEEQIKGEQDRDGEGVELNFHAVHGILKN